MKTNLIFCISGKISLNLITNNYINRIPEINLNNKNLIFELADIIYDISKALILVRKSYTILSYQTTSSWGARKAWHKITIFAIHSPFLLPFFLGWKRKGEKNNQSRDFKSCLSGSPQLLELYQPQLSGGPLYMVKARPIYG